MIWLVILSTALILVWGASEAWSISGLWRRAGQVLHLGLLRRRAEHPR